MLGRFAGVVFKQIERPANDRIILGGQLISAEWRGSLLILAGERKKEVPAGGDRVSVYARERFGGPFRRVVSLPEDADPGRVTAKYRDGFLRVSIAKRESSKPRHIEVH